MPRRLGVPAAIGAGALLALAGSVGFLTLTAYRLPSPSMEPTFHCADAPGCRGETADRVIVTRVPYLVGAPGRGEVAVFRAPPRIATACAGTPGATYIGRVVGLPGERIEERAGVVYVDGKRLDEPYLDHRLVGEESSEAIHLPSGGYAVMGDGRRFACDSRRYGAVPEEAFVGRVVAIYWPPGRIAVR